MSFLKSIFTKDKKERLDKGLSISKKSFFSKLGTAIAGKSKVDELVLDELEEVLIRSDVGVATTIKIIQALEKRVAKDKYLGTRSCFTRGYNELLSKDFFGLKDKDLNDFNLADRINLHFKGVDNVPFSSVEQTWVDKVAKVKTEDEVLDLAQELMDFTDENEDSQGENQEQQSQSLSLIHI